MRACVSLLVTSIGMACLGCANVQLKHSTVKQASTLTDLQHKQVLNNLAAIACNPSAVPFHVNLNDGATQVTDSGSIATEVIGEVALGLGADRSIVDQWTVTPVTDDMTLKLLQIAYRRALGSPEDLYTSDLANELAHELKKQTGVVDDLRTLNALGALNQSDIQKLLANQPPAALDIINRGNLGEAIQAPDSDFGFTKQQIAKAVKVSDNILSTNSDRIVQEREVLTDENLTFPPSIDPETGGALVLVGNNKTPIPYPVDPSTGLPLGDNEGTVKVGEQKAGVLYKKTTPTVAELRRQVKAVNDELLQIQPGWVGVGCKHDVPKDACYVARHKDCGEDCFVWVCPQDREALEGFTLKVLMLSQLVKETQVFTMPGIRYSPATAGPAAGVGGLRLGR